MSKITYDPVRRSMTNDQLHQRIADLEYALRYSQAKVRAYKICTGIVKAAANDNAASAVHAVLGTFKSMDEHLLSKDIEFWGSESAAEKKMALIANGLQAKTESTPISLNPNPNIVIVIDPRCDYLALAGDVCKKCRRIHESA